MGKKKKLSFGNLEGRRNGIKAKDCGVVMANFTSFVDYNNEKTSVAALNVLSPQIASSSKQSRYLQSPINLLPNEIESGSFDDVSFSQQYNESEQGRMFCTKVRLRFCPTVQKNRDLPRRSKYFDDFYDIPLCSIFRILVLPVKRLSKSSKGKLGYEKMERSYSSMEVISRIRLILKDMRVVTIDLRNSQNGTHLANQILHFSKCGPIEKMIQIGAAVQNRGKNEKKPFNSFESWTLELKRCGHNTDSSAPWRVCALHKEGFSNSARGFPMYVVVPTAWSRSFIDRLMQQWKFGRMPVWAWSRRDYGASLLIATNIQSSVLKEELLGKVIETVSRCGGNQERPHLKHLDARFENDVGKAYGKLVDLFAIDSYEQFLEHEKHHFAKLNETKWMDLVRKCMRETNEAMTWIVDRNRTVVLIEEEGRDLSLIVGSLVQICCDPFCRTTAGFQQLVDKMWIAFGHPFGQRLLGRDADTDKETNEVHPSWLLFLDCCAQLIRIYPLEFTFSQHLLIALWDLSITGLVSAFDCNSLEDQLSFGVGGGPFPIEIYYEKEYTRMFSNIWHDAATFAESARMFLLDQPFSLSSKFLQNDLIRPPTTFADIILWEECYSRWILPANVNNGGTILEVQALDRKMKGIADKLPNCKIGWKTHLELPESFSSAYPYSMPEKSSHLIDQNDPMLEEDFEMVGRPSDLQEDTLSITPSFVEMQFAETPQQLTPTNAHQNSFMEKTPSINMIPKQQIVSFSKHELDYSPSSSIRIKSRNDEMTPILHLPRGNDRKACAPATEFLEDGRPVPPPRPKGLNNQTFVTTISSSGEEEGAPQYVTEIDQDGNTVTRF